MVGPQATPSLVRPMSPPDSVDPAASYPVTNVNKVKRVHDRGRYDKETIHAILDAALVCHIAYVIDGQVVGTLCIMDRRPRVFDRLDVAILGGLRDMVVEELFRREEAAA